jgi:hypothetical protein
MKFGGVDERDRVEQELITMRMRWFMVLFSLLTPPKQHKLEGIYKTCRLDKHKQNSPEVG